MTGIFGRNSIKKDVTSDSYRLNGAITRTAHQSRWFGSTSLCARTSKALCGAVLLAGLIPSPLASSVALAGNNSGSAPAGAAASGRSIGKSGNAGSAAGSAEIVAMATEARKRLSDIGYLPIAGQDKATQPSDERAKWAILAFERVSGRKQTGKMDPAELEALRSADRPTPRETGYAHIEVDLTRQVLFVVDANNTVTRTLPISSGSGKLYTFQGKTDRAVTPRGRFVVYSKIGGWRKAPLGMIYYPCYFDKGVAIHGSQSIPNYPASHGCVRIPIATAKELSDLTPVGTVVLVYDNDSLASNVSAH